MRKTTQHRVQADPPKRRSITHRDGTNEERSAEQPEDTINLHWQKRRQSQTILPETRPEKKRLNQKRKELNTYPKDTTTNSPKLELADNLHDNDGVELCSIRIKYQLFNIYYRYYRHLYYRRALKSFKKVKGER